MRPTFAMINTPWALMRRPLLRIAIASLAVLCAIRPAMCLECAYSFRTKNGGGMAAITIDSKTGRILAHEVLLNSPEFRRAHKVRRGMNASTWIMSNDTKTGPHLAVVAKSPLPTRRTIQLPGQPVEIVPLTVSGMQQVVVTCDNDWIAVVSLNPLRVERKWNTETLVTPPGNAPRDIAVSEDQKHLAVLCHEDSKKAKKLGCRLLVFDWPAMHLKSDVRFPRDLPTLHYAGNNRLQGPNPRKVLIANNSQRVLVLHELYGAVEIDDWPAMIRGRRKAVRVVSAALDASWGTAFPEHAALFEKDEREFAIVCNSGVQGGCTMMEVKSGAIVWQQALPGGGERPVCMPDYNRVFIICPGVMKRRLDAGIDSVTTPQSVLYGLDLSDSNWPNTIPSLEIPLPGAGQCVTRIGASPFLLVATTSDAQDRSRLLVLDSRTSDFSGRMTAAGIVQRMEHSDGIAREK